MSIVCLYVGVSICVCILVWVCICVCLCACVYDCMDMFMTVYVSDVYICECVYTHVNAILCVHEFICMYVWIVCVWVWTPLPHCCFPWLYYWILRGGNPSIVVSHNAFFWKLLNLVADEVETSKRRHHHWHNKYHSPTCLCPFSQQSQATSQAVTIAVTLLLGAL